MPCKDRVSKKNPWSKDLLVNMTMKELKFTKSKATKLNKADLCSLLKDKIKKSNPPSPPRKSQKKKSHPKKSAHTTHAIKKGSARKIGLGLNVRRVSYGNKPSRKSTPTTHAIKKGSARKIGLGLNVRRVSY